MEKLEIKGVRTPDDIKNVYLKAVEENIKFYRAVSNSGKYYGWETNVVYPQGHHIPAKDGQEWFINDKYVEPVEEVVEQPVEELEVEPIVEENVEETVEEPIVEEVEQPKEEPAEIDYKALYEETLGKLGEVEEELANKDEEIFALKAEIEKISTEYANYKAEIETVKKFFRG